MVLKHRERLHCAGQPCVDLFVGRPDGADQFHDDVQLLLADIQTQFRNRYLAIRHAQLPPEAHKIPALLRLAIIRQATGDHRLNTLPLLSVAKSVSKVRQSHGRTIPTALAGKPSEVIPLGVLSRRPRRTG